MDHTQPILDNPTCKIGFIILEHWCLVKFDAKPWSQSTSAILEELPSDITLIDIHAWTDFYDEFDQSTTYCTSTSMTAPLNSDIIKDAAEQPQHNQQLPALDVGTQTYIQSSSFALLPESAGAIGSTTHDPSSEHATIDAIGP